MIRHLVTAAVVAALGLSSNAYAQLILSDDFEVDSSASYTLVDDSNAASGDGTPDSTSAFAFDYVAAGIPLAPNSTAGDVGGLRLAANETANDAGAADHITAYHNTAVTGSYELTVDIYMQVESAGGTTEFSHVGVAGDPADFNSIFTPIAGAGHFLSMTGDGGSSSDFRHFAPGVTSVPSGDASYLNSDNTTNATGDTYQAIFPGGDFPGSPGNRWTTLTITVLSGNVTYALDGTPIISTAALATDGSVSLGYTDVFSSVGPHAVIYDNLSVTTLIPEPSTALLSVLGLAGFVARRSR